MRWLMVWCAVIALRGCASPRSDEGTQTGAPDRVAVGQSLAEAHSMLLGAGAKDISGNIGIILYPPGQLRWYELRDGTCLCVEAIDEGDSGVTIRGLELGEPGRGYGDKIKWFGQHHRKVTAIELR